MASALRTVGRALNRELRDIPADARFLRARFKDISPVAVGLSPARWNNVRSLAGSALASIGITSLPGRRLTPLSAAWDNLYEALPSQTLRNALSRFVGYCSASGIGPDQVDDAVADRFLQVLQDESIVRDPRRVHRSACYSWNIAGHRVQAWPQRKLTVPRYLKTYALPWASFPASLRDDTERWLAVLSGQDLLAADAPAHPLRAATVNTRREHVRWFASALVHRGCDAASLRSLGDLVAVETFKNGLRFFLDRAGGKPTRHIHNIASRAALRQFDDARNVDALLSFPDAVVNRARRRGRAPSMYRALDVQIAVAVELLLMAPVRLANLAAIRLDRNLVRTGRSGPLHLIFPSADVKNDQELEFPLPAETAALIDLYCLNFRPRLADGANDWLFPGQNGDHKCRHTLVAQIRRRVQAATGISISPHQFRHVTAKLFLDANPGSYEVMRRVLGHRSVDTTTVFYTGLETAAAVRHFDAQILRLRAVERAADRQGRERGHGRARDRDCRQ